jgi:RNA polymerase sigma-70 factor (ECF subfamily)
VEGSVAAAKRDRAGDVRGVVMSHRDPKTEVSKYSDEALLTGFGARDRQLTVRFVHHFQARVYGVAFAIVRDIARAEDIAQQSFQHARLHADTYDPRRGSVRRWLLGITHTLAIHAVHIQPPTPVNPEHLDPLMNHLTRTPGQAQLLNPEEPGSASVHSALAALPMEQARAVIMAVCHGMTAHQIADYEHVPLDSAKDRIRTGLLKLGLPRTAPQHHEE